MLVLSCSNKYQKVLNSDDDYPIIPKPKELTIKKGRFLLNSNTAIISPKNLAQETEYLSNMFSSISGISLAINSSATKSGNIKLELDSTIENIEGYTLSVKYDAIVISGKTSIGVF